MAAAVVLAGLAFWLTRGGDHEEMGMTFGVRRGPLDINILEGGSVEALESQEIRSEIKGYQGTKILNIVDEGYLVTEEDVRQGKVLVELDSSEIRDRIITEEIQFQSTLAGLTEAQQAYDIQLNQNISDIKAAEQKAKFARMDFEKFMGEHAGREILAKLGLDEEPWTNSLAALISLQSLPMPAGYTDGSLFGVTNSQKLEHLLGAAMPPGAENARPALTNSPPPVIVPPPLYSAASLSNAMAQLDFSKYADTRRLEDGAANQQLRKLEDDKLLSEAELKQAQTKFEATKRLHARNFVTKTELENDEISLKKADLKLKTAETSLNLFKKYEFQKQAEEFLSKYDEALRTLQRTEKEAISKLAQAQAKLRSAEGRFKIEYVQRTELHEQMQKCVIRAQKPGLVVYAQPSDHWNGSEAIREGATVRERQRIITIPDMTQMAVRIKIHESHIKKVRKGLQTKVTVDAFDDEGLTGEVSRVSVLPDSQNRWMNPDLKVYITFISIEGAHDWLKPGMSAKVEIMVKRLEDVLYVPLQAVTYSQGKQVCFVANGSGTEERQVEVGEFNDEFIEIKNGLKQGDLVLLRAPEGSRDEAPATEEQGEPKPEPAPAPRGPEKAGPEITSRPPTPPPGETPSEQREPRTERSTGRAPAS
jgi:multidrug efflux pump subunit AcrA (membrane-fusion protein)